jgi:hypothetical protein
MLLDNIAPGTIADTLKVSCDAVYYHKRRLDLQAALPTVSVQKPLGRKRAFRPGINEVYCLFTFLHALLYLILSFNTKSCFAA